MNPKNYIRAKIKQLNKAQFSIGQMKIECQLDMSPSTVGNILRELLADCEIKLVGRVTTGKASIKILVEGELKFDAEHEDDFATDDKLVGMRKVYPQYFTDPHLSGSYRIINNGVGM